MVFILNLILYNFSAQVHFFCFNLSCLSRDKLTEWRFLMGDSQEQNRRGEITDKGRYLIMSFVHTWRLLVLEDSRVTSTSERVCDPPLLIQSSKRSMRSPWWGCGFWFDPHSLFSNLLFQTAISLSFSLSLSSSNLHPANLPLPFRLLDCNLAAGDGLLTGLKVQIAVL